VLSKNSYVNQFRGSGRVVRNTILFVLLIACNGANAWGQACQAKVTGPELATDSGGSGPLHLVSFLGYVTNPPPPVNNGLPWYPDGMTNLVTFSHQSTCETNWTWKAESTTGTWVGKPGEKVKCKYRLEHDQAGPNCEVGYTGHFTIVCSGISCSF
jgi:hypothetical protein